MHTFYYMIVSYGFIIVAFLNKNSQGDLCEVFLFTVYYNIISKKYVLQTLFFNIG